MTRDEFNKVYNYIQNEYNDFDGDYDEWYNTLGDYSYEDILKKINERRSSTAPIHTHLIKGLKPEEKVADWITECDYCKTRFVIKNNDMTDFEKHYRRCQKIDFIDRMTFRKCQKHIPMVEYYQKTDADLESAYRKAMEYYLTEPKKDVIKKI